MDAISLIQLIITAVAYTITLMAAHWLLGPLIFIAIIPSLILKILRARQLYIFDYDTLTPTRRRLAYFRDLQSKDEFAKETRIFNLGKHFLSQWRLTQNKWKNEVLKDEGREIKASAINDLVLNVVFALSSVFIVYLIIGDQMSIGSFVIMTQAIIRLQEGVEAVLRILRNLYQDGLFAYNLFHFLDQPISRVSTGSTSFPKPIKKGISFEHVWFKYPGSETWTLKDISFHVQVGETISLVGQNGSGKTTLIKLLLGMFKPQKGRILIDGIAIEQLAEDELRQNMTAIFQDFVQYDFSLRENIELGSLYEKK